MTLNDYQERAMRTCTPNSNNEFYMLMGLAEEAGELNGKFAKAIRAGKYKIDPVDGRKKFCLTKEEINDIRAEIGDVLWMCAGISKVLGLSLEEVGMNNLIKLADRQRRNTIEGSGDHR